MEKTNKILYYNLQHTYCIKNQTATKMGPNQKFKEKHQCQTTGHHPPTSRKKLNAGK